MAFPDAPEQEPFTPPSDAPAPEPAADSTADTASAPPSSQQPRASSTRKAWRLRFMGSAEQFLGIQLINMLLSIISLGLYYPWAKANALRYFAQYTELAGSRFVFHGTGQELFRGYMRALAIAIGFGTVILVLLYSGEAQLALAGQALGYVLQAVLVPLALYGMLRYRLSRTSWRGIHGGYRGTQSDLFKVYIRGQVLTILTLGLYFPWFINDLRREVFSNIRIGSLRMRYTGEGLDLLWLYVKLVLLVVPTFGIYFFWHFRDMQVYLINHIVLEQEGEYVEAESFMTVSDYASTSITNTLMKQFSIGLLSPVAAIRSYELYVSSIRISPNFDPDAVVQTEDDFRDATSEDLADMFDVGIN